MPIVGIGVDILNIKRIEKVFSKYPERFERKILNPEELVRCPHEKNKKIRFIAKHFSAKEACSKAFGTGIGSIFGFHDITLRKYDSGQPYVIVNAKKSAFNGKNLKIHLSYSDEENIITSFCVVEVG